MSKREDKCRLADSCRHSALEEMGHNSLLLMCALCMGTPSQRAQCGWRGKEELDSVDPGQTRPQLSRSPSTGISYTDVRTFGILRWNQHFISVVFLPKHKTPVCSWEKHQANLNRETFYEIPDRRASKPSRSSETKRVWETVTAQRCLMRHDHLNAVCCPGWDPGTEWAQ